MIDVLGFALTFLLAWHGRDKVWTPKFEGPAEARFEQAMKHYKVKMGITDELVFDLHPGARFAGDANRCSSVEAAWISGEGPAGFDGYVAGWRRVAIVSWWGKGKGCSSVRPEFWGMHESCHLRYQHHMIASYGATRGEPATSEAREAEAKECMIVYSAKERR
jgi:hypothetical protein